MSRKFSLSIVVLATWIMAVLCLGHAASADISGISAGTFQLNGNDVATTPSPGPPTNPLTPSISGSVLTLTTEDNNPSGPPYYGPGQESSAIYTGGVQGIDTFTASFTYQEATTPAGPSDGVTFVIENDPAGTGALGGSGGYLGYGYNGVAGITKSVAVALNLYSGNNPETPNIGGTGIWEDGAQVGSYIATSNGTAGTTVNLLSGDLINVVLTYDGTTLTETLTDPSGDGGLGSTFTTTYTVDIPGAALADGDTAYIGFTGAYGANGDAPVQQISAFTYTSTPDVTGAVPLPSAASTGLALLAGLGLLTLARRRMAQAA